MRSRQNSVFAVADAIFSYTHRRKSDLMWESRGDDGDDDDGAGAGDDPVPGTPGRVPPPPDPPPLHVPALIRAYGRLLGTPPYPRSLYPVLMPAEPARKPWGCRPRH